MVPDEMPNHYSWRRITLLWVAVTAPAAALVWVAVPTIIARSDASPVVVWLVTLLACGAWTSFVEWWALRRDGVPPRADALGASFRLTCPTLPQGRFPRVRLRARLLALAALAYVPLVVLHIPSVLPFLLRPVPLLQSLLLRAMQLQPGYARPAALGDPALAHSYWLVPLALTAWAVQALLGEELFFRGLLLSRMRDRSGRVRVGLNSLLYFAYCLAVRPFSAPARLLYGLAAAFLAERFRSTRLALGLRAVEGLAVVALSALAVSTRPLPPLGPALSLPHIARQPRPAVWGDEMRRVPWPALPKYVAGSSDGWQLDLRGKDLAKIDLAGRTPDLLMSTFDTTTIWPAVLPQGFSPRDVLELGKNPGLGVRRLHARGITGRGVGIGIVDMPLLVNHQEIAERLRWYEEMAVSGASPARMHGPAVASIAVGRSVGVAPDAGLYFVAFGENPRGFLSLYQHAAYGIRRLVEVNRGLPAGEKIRVISISQGWMPGETGYEEVTQAIRRARADGIFVIYCSMERDTPLAFHGLGREALADPDRLDSFGPGLWWMQQFFRRDDPRARILAPMDARTTASPTGIDHYVFYRHGGWSWVAPYLAGLYALALQVNPELSGERFWELAMATGRTRVIASGENRRSLGRIVQPEALIAAVTELRVRP